jgi:hypothetical protein
MVKEGMRIKKRRKRGHEHAENFFIKSILLSLK